MSGSNRTTQRLLRCVQAEVSAAEDAASKDDIEDVLLFVQRAIDQLQRMHNGILDYLEAKSK